MSFNLDRLLNLAQKTGNGLIVYDKNEGRHFAIVDINEYERLLEVDDTSCEDCPDVGELTERELIDKINSDLALWKSKQEEDEYSNRNEVLEDEMATDTFDPFAESCAPNDDWHSAGEILNKYKPMEESNESAINFLDEEKNENEKEIDSEIENEIKQIPFENHGEVEADDAEKIEGEEPIFFEEAVE